MLLDTDGSLMHFSTVEKYEGKLYDLSVQCSRASFQRRRRVQLNIQTEDLATRELRVIMQVLTELADKMDALSY